MKHAAAGGLAVLLLVVGLVLATTRTNGFTVTPKEACLPPEGISFKVDYLGAGTLIFKVVPPTKEKESKK